MYLCVCACKKNWTRQRIEKERPLLEMKHAMTDRVPSPIERRETVFKEKEKVNERGGLLLV